MITTSDPTEANSHQRTGRPRRAMSGRRIRPRRGLPSGRALLGGVLIGTAMVTAITLSRSSSAPATEPVVVASMAIRPGDLMGSHNLATLELALPDSLLGSTYPEASSLEGTVARSHIQPGELLQRGSVVEATAAQRAAAPAREISLRIDADRAVEGRLDSGDRVDMLATYGNGIDAVTLVVLADAPILSVSRAEGGVGSSRAVVITLALDARADTVAVAHAVDNADVTVVRTTTAHSDTESDLAPFRPAVPPREREMSP